MRVLVVGSAIVDLAVRPTSVAAGDTSNEAEIVWGAGGAGRNVAENLARLGCRATLVTDLGDDALGGLLGDGLAGLDVEVRVARRGSTGVYVALLGADGSLDRGFCQTSTEQVTLGEILAVLPDLDRFAGAVLDANLATPVLAGLAHRLRAAGIPFALEPTAIERARRVLPAIQGCALVKPDRSEATALTGRPCETDEDAARCATALLEMGARAVIVSLGPEGLHYADSTTNRHLQALPTRLVNVTGAGDALLAAAFAGLLSGLPPERFLEAGRRAAALTCACPLAVSPDMTPALLD